MSDRDTTPTVELDGADLAALVGDLDDPDDDGDLIATDLEIVEGSTPFDAAIRLAADTDEGPVAVLLPLRPAVIRALHASLVDLYRDQKAALANGDLNPKPPDPTETADPVLSNSNSRRPRPRSRSRSGSAGSDNAVDPDDAAQDPPLGSRLNPLGGAMRQVVDSKKATAAAALILAALLLCWLIWLIAT